MSQGNNLVFLTAAAGTLDRQPTPRTFLMGSSVK